jgi:four helix bundle protein
MAGVRQPAWTGSESGFTGLIAWQRAYQLVLDVYRATESFPKHEQFGLTLQVRRAAVSIASNVAEGWGRGTTSDYLRFLHMARGSASELQTQFWLAQDLGYLQAASAPHDKIDEVQRLLNGVIRALRDKEGL